MPKEFITVNHGKNPIDLSYLRDKLSLEFIPVELHHKEDGAIGNTPSFCFVMTRATSDSKVIHIYAQISLDMLNKAMNELGYDIVKK